ncbi:helix-turn-helix transcriptional regulator [Phenylobacterium sp.]|uniref:helix-turn-helix transcriptional regulator n=1 Tax=Phenylobacterium sp. TaxID=1871053 RepID=UPI0025E2FD08|nr:helix-turn-helix transcriptional regulator [Phenylobacterium sp.]
MIDKAIAAIYAGVFDHPLAQFQDYLFDTVRPAIGFDSAIWITGVHETSQTNSLWYHRRAPVDVAAYLRHFTAVDTVRVAALARPGTAYRIEDTRDMADYYASEVYRDIGRRGRMEQVMGISQFNAITRLSHYLIVYGHDRARPFKDTERDAFQRLLPHMIAAWRHRQMSEMLQIPLPPGETQRTACGRAIADYHGVVEAADDGFATVIASAFPGWRGPRLPDVLCDLLARADDSAYIRSLNVRVLRSTQSCVLTLIGSEATAQLTTAELRAAQLYASGATQAAIAERLGVSQHTIRNQLATVYDKLGIHNKVELSRHFPESQALAESETATPPRDTLW